MHKICVLFYEVDWSDWLSRLIWFGYRLLRIDSQLTHVAVVLDNLVSDITIHGVAMYTKPLRKPKCVAAWEVGDLHLAFAQERLTAITAAGTRLKATDVVMRGIKAPTGNNHTLLCTDFVEIVLGLEPTHSLPHELLNRLEKFSYVQVYKA